MVKKAGIFIFPASSENNSGVTCLKKGMPYSRRIFNRFLLQGLLANIIIRRRRKMKKFRYIVIMLLILGISCIGGTGLFASPDLLMKVAAVGDPPPDKAKSKVKAEEEKPPELFVTVETLPAMTQKWLKEIEPYNRHRDVKVRKDKAALLVIDMQNFFFFISQNSYKP